MHWAEGRPCGTPAAAGTIRWVPWASSAPWASGSAHTHLITAIQTGGLRQLHEVMSEGFEDWKSYISPSYFNFSKNNFFPVFFFFLVFQLPFTINIILY